MSTQEIEKKLADNFWSKSFNRENYYSDLAHLTIWKTFDGFVVEGNLFGETGIRGYEVVGSVYESFEKIEDAKLCVATHI